MINKILVWIAVAVLGRLIIHVPDVTPLSALALLAPTVFSKRFSLCMTLATLVLSDVALHFLLHESVFGNWTFFTYSGWIFVTLLGFLFARNPTFSRGFLFAGVSTIGFWIWTNAGSFLVMHLYPHTMNGLLNCYLAALPFLKNSLMGAMVWMGVLMVGFATQPIRPFFKYFLE